MIKLTKTNSFLRRSVSDDKIRFSVEVHNISFPPEMKPDKFYVTLQKSNDKSGNGDISRSKDVSVKPNQNHVHMGVTVVLQATMYLSGEGYYNPKTATLKIMMMDSHRIAYPIGQIIIPLNEIINNSIPSFPEYGDLNNLHVLHRRTDASWNWPQTEGIGEDDPGNITVEYTVKAEAVTSDAAASLDRLHCNLEDHEHNPYTTVDVDTDSMDEGIADDNIDTVVGAAVDTAGVIADKRAEDEHAMDKESVEDIDVPVNSSKGSPVHPLKTKTAAVIALARPKILLPPPDADDSNGVGWAVKSDKFKNDILTASPVDFGGSRAAATESAPTLSFKGLTLTVTHIHYPDMSIQRRMDIRDALEESKAEFPTISFESPLQDAMIRGLEAVPGKAPDELPPAASAAAYVSVFNYLCAYQMFVQECAECSLLSVGPDGVKPPAIEEDEVLRQFVAHLLHVSHDNRRAEKKNGVAGTGPLEYFALIQKVVEIESKLAEDTHVAGPPIVYIQIELGSEDIDIGGNEHTENSVMVAYDPLRDHFTDVVTNALVVYGAKVGRTVDVTTARARVLELSPNLLQDLFSQFMLHLESVVKLQKEGETMILEGTRHMADMVEHLVALQHDYNILAAAASSGLTSTSDINTLVTSRVPKAIQMENEQLKHELEATKHSYEEAMHGQQTLREEIKELQTKLHEMEMLAQSEKLREVALRDEVETQKDYIEELKASWAIKYRHFDKYKSFYEDNYGSKPVQISTPVPVAVAASFKSASSVSDDKFHQCKRPVLAERIVSPSGSRRGVGTTSDMRVKSPTKQHHRDGLAHNSTLSKGGTSLAPRKQPGVSSRAQSQSQSQSPSPALRTAGGLHRSHAPDRVPLPVYMPSVHPSGDRVLVTQEYHPHEYREPLQRPHTSSDSGNGRLNGSGAHLSHSENSRLSHSSSGCYGSHDAFMQNMSPVDMITGIDNFIIRSNSKLYDLGNSNHMYQSQQHKSYPVNPFHAAARKSSSRSITPGTPVSRSRPHSQSPSRPNSRPSSSGNGGDRRWTADESPSPQKLVGRPKLQFHRNSQ